MCAEPTYFFPECVTGLVTLVHFLQKAFNLGGVGCERIAYFIFDLVDLRKIGSVGKTGEYG